MFHMLAYGNKTVGQTQWCFVSHLLFKSWTVSPSCHTTVQCFCWYWLEMHRIWIRIRPDTNILGSGKIQIRPDPNSLDPVNRIHYHVVVPITVSMHCFIIQCQESVKSLNKQEIHGAASQQIAKLSCLLWFDVLISSLVAIQLWSGLGYIRIRRRSGSGQI